MRISAVISLVLSALMLATSSASALEIFNAIGGNENNRGPSQLPPAAVPGVPEAHDLEIYIDTADGGTPVDGNLSLVCSGPGADGTHTCATDFQYEASGSVEITGFTAHPDRIAEVGPDYCIGHQPDAQHLRHNCGNPFDGENGVLPLGTLHVEVDGDAGQVRMISGLHVPVDLTTAAVAPADLAVVNDCIPGSAPDHDCDNNPDVSDLCPHFAEVAPAADANGNGRGDECECGDQSGDGFVNIDDIIAINRVLFGLEAPTPFCDAGGDINSVSPAPFDGECNIIDILRVNDVIFGSSAYCARHPFDP